jgi:hypothetical protein
MLTEMLLGEILVRRGFCTPEQLAEGLRVQRATGMRIGEALVQSGAANWRQVQEAIRIQDRMRKRSGAPAKPAAGTGLRLAE